MSAVNSNIPSSTGSAAGVPVTLSVLYALFFLASLVAVQMLAPGARIPNPFGSDDVSRHFFLENPGAIRVSDFLQLASSICLATLGATLNGGQYLRRSSSIAAALTLSGSVGAALLLALSALLSWALASPGTDDPGSAFHTLQFLPFLMGGPGWAGFFAIFLTGLTLAGTGVLPRWIIWTGYFLVLVSALSTLAMLTIYAAPCLPIARFLSFIWLIVISLYLSRK